MTDVTEIGALKASLRGARQAAQALGDVAGRVDGLAAGADVAESDLDELQRLTLANAVAAEALRGLVETMLKRRGKLASASVEAGNAGVDE